METHKKYVLPFSPAYVQTGHLISLKKTQYKWSVNQICNFSHQKIKIDLNVDLVSFHTNINLLMCLNQCHNISNQFLFYTIF